MTFELAVWHFGTGGLIFIFCHFYISFLIRIAGHDVRRSALRLACAVLMWIVFAAVLVFPLFAALFAIGRFLPLSERDTAGFLSAGLYFVSLVPAGLRLRRSRGVLRDVGYPI